MKTILTLLLFLCCNIYSQAQVHLTLDAESGAATFGYNDVRIPGAGGTRFSISDELDHPIQPYFRGRVQVDLGKRHSILALYAPLTINSSGAFDRDIAFEGQTFDAHTPTDVSWKFNSYRLSYQFNIVAKEKLTFALGLTGKIRDARIALSSAETSAEKTNVGFVPLIRFYMDWNFTSNFHLILDGDALAAPQGRAEDVLLAVAYAPVEKLRFRLGYRLLEGGANNDEVYNFSAVHYLALGASYRF